MSISFTATNEERWSRPRLERDGPVRNAGGFYRTAEGARAGLGGLPLTSAEDAVVATVRLAYNVAASQVERSTRLARRLREAGDRAVGARSDRKALDATEQLIFRTMMSALTWLEGAAAESDSPLQRLMIAQYRLLGQLLGVTPSEKIRPPGPAETTASPAGGEVPLDRLKFIFEGGYRRPVRARQFEITSGPLVDVPVEFYSIESIASDPITGRLALDAEGRATVRLKIERLAPTGLWKSAVCDGDSAQIGLIEIEL